eukprot:TRINITY_DN107735_c0_g1_i1.p1 TRINITY_DN107735_c0_g1~~TRINITY_DN107735_c0_g1_i1.p1  ORF type:complete len:265 (+),score=10.77 TRINITY_DN107735_c0_g1_i1:77-871(+)
MADTSHASSSADRVWKKEAAAKRYVEAHLQAIARAPQHRRKPLRLFEDLMPWPGERALRKKGEVRIGSPLTRDELCGETPNSQLSTTGPSSQQSTPPRSPRALRPTTMGTPSNSPQSSTPPRSPRAASPPRSLHSSTSPRSPQAIRPAANELPAFFKNPEWDFSNGAAWMNLADVQAWDASGMRTRRCTYWPSCRHGPGQCNEETSLGRLKWDTTSAPPVATTMGRIPLEARAWSTKTPLRATPRAARPMHIEHMLTQMAIIHG